MKIKCDYCGRTNKEEREMRKSCGADLPDFEPDIADEPYFMDGGVTWRDAPSLFLDWDSQ